MFRLRQKHSRRRTGKEPRADAKRIIAEQSLVRAMLGGIAAAMLLSMAWAQYALSTGRVFPWFSVLVGALVGLAVQRFGRGLGWHYPVIAAVIAGLAAYFGNLMIGVVETGRYIEASPARVFAGLSIDTMENFFGNTINAVDHIYAFCAAGVAAFFANRRLSRAEVYAIRTLEREQA